MKKITQLISYFLFLISSTVFSASYPASCPSEAQSIVDAVGGCLAVDKGQYSAVYEKCCAVPSAPVSATILWVTVAVVVLGLGAAGMRYYSARKKRI